MALVRCCYNVLRTARNRLDSTTLTTRTLPKLLTQPQTLRGIAGTLTLRNEQQPEGAGSTETVPIDASKNREIKYPVETSIQYLESEAYQQTYGANLVWEEYRRNHKGVFAPYKTRKTCIRQEKLSTGNPCPICRDEYLVLDYRNINLLKQFICPHTGSILNFNKTGLCQRTHRELVVAIEKARDYGFLPYDVPHRVYDYSEYTKLT